MNYRPIRLQNSGVVIAALLLVLLVPILASAGNTYVTDLIPDVEVTEPNCYSFDILVSQASGTTATLTLRVWDVDEEDGELDTVKLNGQLLGTLTGTNEAWSTTVFDITSVVQYNQNNTVQICIDPSGGEPTEWVATIDWGQILIDGGSAADADIISVSASGTWNALDVDTVVHATNADTYRLELNLLDSLHNNKDIAVDTFALPASATTTRTNTLALPSEPAATETFTIEALLFNDTTGVLQELETTTWTYLVNQPPVATPDAAETTRGSAVSIGVLGNDSDPDGGALTLVSVTSPQHGRAELAGNEVRYMPDLFYIGTDAFEYTVRDAQGLTASATVDIDVLDPNAPPVANADGAYLGMVGDSILLDARFSNDPDIQDILQYRWDLNGDGEWDTDWLTQPTHEVIFERPYRGLITLEVRDIYLGQPNGTSDQTTAYALIEPRPTQLAVSVYVDLNSNGTFDEEDVGLPGVSLLLDEELEFVTEEDGTALVSGIDPGMHTVRISGAGVAYLQERGFYLSEEGLATIELQSGEWVALFFNPEARGFLEVDLGAEEDDNEQPSGEPLSKV